MKKFNLILIFISFITFGFGQINFEIAYSTGGFDKAEGIVQTYDSGYAVIGSSENFIGITDVYLMRIDKYGSLLWSKTFGDVKIDQGHDIVQTTDSGLAILGYTNNSDSNSYQLFFIKTDKNGDTLFTKKIGGIDWDFGYSLKQTSDGGYILAGETYQNGNSKGYAVKLNSLGNISWSKTYGGINNDKFEEVIITSIGDFIFAGSTLSFGNDEQAYIVKTNNLGGLIWQKSFGNPGIDFAKSIIELTSGDLIFVGGTNTAPYADIDNWAVKLNSLGILQQSIFVNDYSTTTPIAENDDWNETVILHGSDTLVFAGMRTYENNEAGNVYSYMHKTDLSLPKIGEFQKYLNTYKEITNEVINTKDNGIIYACTAEGFSTGGSSIYLIKRDASLINPPPYFNSITFQHDISSLDEIENDFIINFYPNPVSNIGNFTFKNEGNINLKINIRDITGKLITTKNIENTLQSQIDFSDYAKGVYIANIITDKILIKSIKIIVTN